MAGFGGVQISAPDDIPNDYGRWLIHGPQGAGKTTLASTVARMGKTLYLDLTGERGIRSFRGADYAKNIEVARPESVTALDDIYWALAKGGHGYKAVVVDSLTSVQKMAMRFILGHSETAVKEIKQGTAPADQRSWGQTLDIMIDMATFWYGLADGQRDDPLHVVMTAQTKVTEDDFGNTQRIPDVQKGALSIALATPDYIVYADVEENLDAISDESLPPVNHIIRFGAHPEYRTKARLPVNLRGRMPSVIGRKSAPDLYSLSRTLGIGGVPAPAPKSTPKAVKDQPQA